MKRDIRFHLVTVYDVNDLRFEINPVCLVITTLQSVYAMSICLCVLVSMSVCLCIICLLFSVFLIICMSVCLCACMFVYLCITSISVILSTCVSVSLCISISPVFLYVFCMFLFWCSVFLNVCVSECLHFCVSVCLSVYMYVFSLCYIAASNFYYTFMGQVDHRRRRLWAVCLLNITWCRQ